MHVYQQEKGGLPPGAKGLEGGGQREHSTNLMVKQPSTYAWANAQTTPTSWPTKTNGKKAGSSNSSITKSTASVTAVHHQAMTDLGAFSKTLERVAAKHFNLVDESSPDGRSLKGNVS
jgi:hypothetical protein